MEQKSMTALINTFSRAYHSVKNKKKALDNVNYCLTVRKQNPNDYNLYLINM